MEDRDIVALYLRRDETAVKYTAEKYGSRLRGLALGITGDSQSAEECENDAYLAAWNSIPPKHPQDYFFPFLARIVRNQALNLCRGRDTQKRGTRVEELSRELEQRLPGDVSVESELDRRELGRMLNGFLAGLPEDKRRVFLRRYWYMEPVGDIARRFGYSQSKVKSMLARCRTQLRAYLEQEGYGL